MAIDDAIFLPALRDLIGLCRALFIAWTAERRGPVELQELVDIGRELSLALELARKAGPGTIGHRAALQRAERATERLCSLVDAVTPLRPTVDAAVARVVRRVPPERTTREERREQRRRRG